MKYKPDILLVWVVQDVNYLQETLYALLTVVVNKPKVAKFPRLSVIKKCHMFFGKPVVSSPLAHCICRDLTSIVAFPIFVAVNLRLQGSSSASGTGRVEIFYNGQWGTICDNSWSRADAEVACRELGYHYAVKANQGYEVPDGTGPIWLDDVGCNGNEESLASCFHRGVGIHNCHHTDDAGVECSTTGIMIISTQKLF